MDIKLYKGGRENELFNQETAKKREGKGRWQTKQINKKESHSDWHEWREVRRFQVQRNISSTDQYSISAAQASCYFELPFSYLVAYLGTTLNYSWTHDCCSRRHNQSGKVGVALKLVKAVGAYAGRDVRLLAPNVNHEARERK